jgi:histone acetyltransferase (RNA polymerase elongator complex component)
LRHFNIPFFIPELGCPHQCVFCDQHRISGTQQAPKPEEVDSQVAAYLETFPKGERQVEIAFFGGNFTGLPQNEQEAYLQAAAKWIEAGKVGGIRLSTRPDYINPEVLKLLKKYGVSSIELGAQSLDEDVLRLAGRGHSAKHVEEASKMILDAGFVLGLQMMTGLPGDTMEKTMYTARRIKELGASETRIYPTLVIRGTQLEQMYLEGSYQPLSLDETIDRCKQLLLFFEDKKVKVLRLGLHPSEGLSNGSELVTGPFHPALKELVNTTIWKDLFRESVKNKTGQCLRLSVAPKELNAAIGHKAANKKWLLKHFEKVEFKTNTNLIGRAFHADYC